MIARIQGEAVWWVISPEEPMEWTCPQNDLTVPNVELATETGIVLAVLPVWKTFMAGDTLTMGPFKLVETSA